MPAPAYASIVPSSATSAAAQRDRPLAVAVRIDPADGPAVAAAVDRLQVGDRAQGGIAGRAGDGGRRVEGGGQVERGRTVAQRALDVAGEVPQVRQLEGERELARRDAAGVRPERAEHALHREPVLVEILRRRGQGEGGSRIAGRVGAARGAAGQDARGHGARVDAHEGLRARADQPVDGEGPGVGVAEGEVDEHAPQVAAGGQVTDQVAGEHDLLDASGQDAFDGHADRLEVAVLRERAGVQHDAELGAERGRRHGRASPAPLTRVTKLTPSRLPITTRGTMSTLVNSDSSANAKAPNATSPLPERPTSSRTVDAAAMLFQVSAASRMRSGPRNSSRAASPSPAIPSPRRMKSSGWRASSSGSSEVIGSTCSVTTSKEGRTAGSVTPPA